MSAPRNDPLTDQLIEAFGKAADRIDTVAPPPFEPSPFVLPTQPTRTSRKPLLLVAALVLIAGAVGTLIVRAERTTRDPQGVATETETETETAVGFRLPSDLDDLLLDLIAPTNGDAWLMARFRFGIAVEETNVALFNECRRRNGQPEVERPRPRRLHEGGVGHYGLPGLETIGRYGVYRRQPDPPGPSSGLEERCESGHPLAPSVLTLGDSSPSGASAPDDFEASPAAAWLDDTTQLSSSYKYNDVFKAAESSPEWPAAERCVADAGGPSNIGDPELQEPYQVMLHWVETEEARRAPPGTGPLSEQELTDMAHPEAEAFVRCTQPYFDVIETILEVRRADFVEEHEDELVDLRERFESLD